MVILVIYTVFFVAFDAVCWVAGSVATPKRLPRQTFECFVQTVVTMENWLVKEKLKKIVVIVAVVVLLVIVVDVVVTVVVVVICINHS